MFEIPFPVTVSADLYGELKACSGPAAWLIRSAAAGASSSALVVRAARRPRASSPCSICTTITALLWTGSRSDTTDHPRRHVLDTAPGGPRCSGSQRWGSVVCALVARCGGIAGPSCGPSSWTPHVEGRRRASASDGQSTSPRGTAASVRRGCRGDAGTLPSQARDHRPPCGVSRNASCSSRTHESTCARGIPRALAWWAMIRPSTSAAPAYPADLAARAARRRRRGRIVRPSSSPTCASAGALLDQAERLDGVRPASDPRAARTRSTPPSADSTRQVRAALEEAIARVRQASAAQVPRAGRDDARRRRRVRAALAAGRAGRALRARRQGRLPVERRHERRCPRRWPGVALGRPGLARRSASSAEPCTRPSSAPPACSASTRSTRWAGPARSARSRYGVAELGLDPVHVDHRPRQRLRRRGEAARPRLVGHRRRGRPDRDPGHRRRRGRRRPRRRRPGQPGRARRTGRRACWSPTRPRSPTRVAARARPPRAAGGARRTGRAPR